MGHAPGVTTLRTWLESQGEFALGLSSGFFGFYAHAGVLSALDANGLRASGFHGSSAGALISACAAAGLAADEIERILAELRRGDFWDPDLRLGLGRRRPGLLRGEKFASRLAAILPVSEFEACPARLEVSLFDVHTRRTRVVSAGAIVPAVVASCAVPIMFQPIAHEGSLYLDGGIRDRPGIAGHLAQGRRLPMLHHHLISRSPWRRRADPGLRPPRAPGIINLSIGGLVRVGPHRMARGPEAFAMAREATLLALSRELPPAGRDGGRGVKMFAVG